MTHIASFSLLAALISLGACVAAPPAAPAAAAQSILRGSTPGGGATVRGPVSQLELRFSPPARLDEVTVTDGDGLTMPIMVTAVGEVARYSIPLPDLGPGTYTVAWDATAAGAPHRGSFRFTVR